ncbi:SAG1386/EF1546 family surface-associated protein [uncultured Limosilactobacillus sp.]|uniref:SAG1386/EF1546 family surface-associated protein n=1 Tax=uncultured Limosilactobacillus sp. TaxID=2837629 RepID=UPI0025E641FE|nr:SAG1386/EF1546 family surface-associated protein [uncultured Limosilactobacillus sp.]
MSEKREDQHQEDEKLWDKTFTQDPNLGSDGHLSRTEYRKHNSHNAMVTTILVIVIIVLAAAPVLYWMNHQQSFNHPVRTEKTAKSSHSASKKKHSTTHRESKRHREQATAKSSRASGQLSSEKTTSSSHSTAGAKYTTVEQGQGIYRVAVNNGLTVDELARLNNISPNAQLHPGQRLRVK